MYLIPAEGYKVAGVQILIIKKGEIWASMKDVHAGLGLENMSDPVLKQIYGIYKTKTVTKEQIRKNKMTERKIFKIFNNLTKDKLNTKNNKNVYVRNDVMTTTMKPFRGKKKKRKKDAFRKKTNDSRIWNFRVSRTWS